MPNNLQVGLYAYKYSNGTYCRVCRLANGEVSHCIGVPVLEEATLFQRGDCPRKDLPNRGRGLELVGVEMKEVKLESL